MFKMHMLLQYKSFLTIFSCFRAQVNCTMARERERKEMEKVKQLQDQFKINNKLEKTVKNMTDNKI